VPQAKLKKSLLSFAMFLVIGILLCLGTLAVGTVFDHSLRSAADLKERIGVRVLAVVPAAAAVKLSDVPAQQPVREARPPAPMQPVQHDQPAPAWVPAPVRNVGQTRVARATVARRGDSTRRGAV